MASITKRILPAKASGKASVRFVVRYRDRAGTQRHQQFERRSAAEQFKTDVEIALRNGVDIVSAEAPAAAVVEVVTFGMVRERWTGLRRVSRARTSTEKSLANHLAALDPMPVAAIKTSDIRAVKNAVIDAGLSAETASAVLRMVKQILDLAAEDGDVPANVAARVKPPTIKRAPLDADDVLTPEESHRLIAEMPERWKALVALLQFGGARWSEGLGVRLRDVDMLHRRIHLGSHVIEEVEGKTIRREWTTRDAAGKNEPSDRWIPMPAIVADLIAEHLTRISVGPDDLLFTNTKGIPPLRGNFRRQVHQPAMKRAGITRNVTVRNLRHTAATMMFASKMEPLDVSRRLGHSKGSTALDVYARFIPGKEDTATAALDALISAHNLRTPGS